MVVFAYMYVLELWCGIPPTIWPLVASKGATSRFLFDSLWLSLRGPLKLQHNKSNVAFRRPLWRTRKSVGLTKACTKATWRVTSWEVEGSSVCHNRHVPHVHYTFGSLRSLKNSNLHTWKSQKFKFAHSKVSNFKFPHLESVPKIFFVGLKNLKFQICMIGKSQNSNFHTWKVPKIRIAHLKDL